MDLFSEVQGLRGEKLGSALLRNMIINSHELREAFLSLLSEKSPFGPISYSSHFACRCEYPTKCNDEKSRGFLDLLIQVDDAVIGIENKFFADFQGGQPHKYFESIKNVAEQLKEINNSPVEPMIVVLCPDEIASKGRKTIINQKNAILITWEEVFSVFNSVNVINNPVSKIVLNEFLRYYDTHLSFIPQYEKKFPHYKKTFQDKGTRYQGELVGKLFSVFPYPGPRLGAGKTWIGYGFYVNSEIDEKGWFGFVSNDELDFDTKNKAELVIATTFRPKLTAEFTEVKLKNKYFLPGATADNTNAWVVNFDLTWKTLFKWREKISPFRTPLGGIHQD